MSEFRKPRLPSGRKQLGSGEPSHEKNSSDVLATYKTHRKPAMLMGLSDATGSMASVWETTRGHVGTMINRLSTVGQLSVNWVAYRDYDDGDDILESSGWRSDSQSLIQFIHRIQCFGGGDFPEAVEHALKFATQDNSATRVVLIGDAPPHEQRDYRKQAARLGELQRPVYTFRVGAHEETKRAFGEIAKLSGGLATDLTTVNDLLDLVSLVVADDMGGGSTVEEFLKDHRSKLSAGSVAFAKRLLKSGE